MFTDFITFVTKKLLKRWWSEGRCWNKHWWREENKSHCEKLITCQRAHYCGSGRSLARRGQKRRSAEALWFQWDLRPGLRWHPRSSKPFFVSVLKRLVSPAVPLVVTSRLFSGPLIKTWSQNDKLLRTSPLTEPWPWNQGWLQVSNLLDKSLSICQKPQLTRSV